MSNTYLRQCVNKYLKRITAFVVFKTPVIVEVPCMTLSSIGTVRVQTLQRLYQFDIIVLSHHM